MFLFIVGSVLKSYASLGGTSEDLGRTQNFLEDAFQSGAAICLICIATVKRNDAVSTILNYLQNTLPSKVVLCCTPATRRQDG